jgi:hypothetical protein
VRRLVGRPEVRHRQRRPPRTRHLRRTQKLLQMLVREPGHTDLRSHALHLVERQGMLFHRVLLRENVSSMCLLI